MQRAALWRRGIPASVVVLVAGAIGATAVTSQGYHARHVALDDGGVWTAQANSADPDNPGSFVGRANVAAGVIDAAVTALPRPQLLQDGSHVIFHDATSGSVTSIDTDLGTTGPALVVPALKAPQGTVALGAPVTQDNQGTPTVDLNAAGEVGLGDDTVGVIDQGTGRVYVLAADALPSGPLTDQRPVATARPGSRLVVGVDGVVHVVSPAGVVDDYSPVGRHLRSSDLGTDLRTVTTPGSPFTVTAVGARAVVLDGNGGVYVEGHRGQLGSIEGAGSGVLQEAGPAEATVLAEAGRSLVRVNLTSGGTTVLSDAGSGAPTAPVYVGERGCSYGAWAGAAAVPADASSTGSPATAPNAVVVCDDGRHYTGAGEANPVWRENHGSALLNDQVTGHNLFFDGVTPLPVDDWSQAQRANKPGDTTGSTTSAVTNPADAPSSVDHPPKATDDTVATRPGVPLIAHVLANDTDPDGDILAVTGLSDTPPAGSGAAVAIVNGGDAVQVTPAAGSLSPVTFSYTVDDGRGLSASARVTVAIHPQSENTPPQVPADEPTVTVAAGARISVDLLRDATDPDGDALTLTAASLPAGVGSVEFTGTGLAVVSPSTAGTVPLTFSVSDGRTVTRATQMIDVEAAGTPVTPQTNTDHLQVDVGVAGTVDVLANDASGSGAPLSLASVSSPPGLTVTQLGGGVLGVTADAVGTTLVRYTATDGTSQSSSTLRVDAVQPGAQTVTAVRDDATLRPGTATVVPVLDNDIDRSGNVLVITGVGDLPPGLNVTQVEHATLSVSDEAPLAAPVSFTYTAGDGTASATGTVVVRPAPGGVDQPPVTVPVTAEVTAGNAIPVDVLAHDFDPEGEALTLVSVAPLAAGQGTVFTEAGELRYVAPGTAPGSVRIAYVVADSAGNTSSGTVTVHVLPAGSTNHPPDPAEVDARVFTGRSVTVVLPLLAADPDGDVVTLVGVTPSGALLGSLGAPLGADRFTFTAGTTGGTQRLDYQVRDGGGLLGSGVVRIGIVAPPAVNSPPVALPDTVAIAPGSLRRVSVLANDSDPDGDPITLDPAALTQPSSGGRPAGRVAVDGGVLDVTAPVGVAPGTPVSFSYGITDGRGGSATSTVTETVTPHPPAAPPVAVDDLVAPQRPGTVVRVNVLANDVIFNGTPDQASLTFAGGPAVTSLGGGVISFTMPQAATTFAYTVTDAAGQSAGAVVSVPTVRGQPPVAAPDTATTTVAKPVTVPVTANDRDPQGLPLKVSGIVVATGGTAVVSAPGSVRFTPAAGFTGLGGFTYRVSDGQLSSLGTATVRVTGAARPLTTTQLAVTIRAGGPAVTADLDAAVGDPDGAPLTFSRLTGAGRGLDATLAGSTLRLRAASSAPAGSALLGYTVVAGGNGAPVRGTVAVSVTPGTTAGPPPEALPDRVSTLAGRPVTIPVLANDVDPLGKGLHLVSVTGGGADGTATVAGSDVVFTPAAAFHGVVSLSYVVANAAVPARQATGAVTVTVTGLPDAPGLPSGSAASHRVALTWAVPGANGGTISGYTVSWNGGTRNCPVNACVIDGLANGHDYTFTVTATDQAGVGPASAASAPIHVDALPGVPQSPVATPGDMKIALTWPVPATDGSAPTSYTVAGSPGNLRQSVSTNAATFTGLTNGTAYTFTVSATNKAGTSDPSAPSAAASPAGIPATPSAPKGSTTADAGKAVATWSAPSSNGSPVTSYTLQVYENGALRDTRQETDTQNLTDTVPATDGDSYTFAVSATNAVGTTPFSPKSSPVTASGRPAQVGTPGAVAGDKTADLTWTAPADNGSAISSYLVAANGGSPKPFTTAGGTYTGLTDGDPYTFTVSACNAVGCGPASSPSPSVTPAGVPDTPQVGEDVVDDSRSTMITWSWNQPNANGAAILAYDLELNGGFGGEQSGTSYSETVPCGTAAQTLGVAARNGRGMSSFSTPVQANVPACNRSVFIAKSTASAGDVSMMLTGFANGTYHYDCTYSNGVDPAPAHGSLTVSQSPQLEDGGYCPLLETTGTNTVYAVVDGVKSNTLQYYP